MTFDMKALREKLASLTSKNNSAGVFKPVEGTTRIRILPCKATPENAFKELYFHYLGGQTNISPKSFGEADPIEEFAQSLIDEGGGKLSKEEYKAAMQFKAKLRTYAYVIDRDNEEDGPKLWGFGKTVYTDLIKIICDDDYGDITDLETGRDIKLTFTPAKKSDTGYAKTSILVSPNITPAAKDTAQVKTWMNEQPDILDVYEKKTYKELQAVLQKYLDVPIDSEEAGTPSSETAVTREEVVAASKKRSVAGAKAKKEFEDVFKDDDDDEDDED